MTTETGMEDTIDTNLNESLFTSTNTDLESSATFRLLKTLHLFDADGTLLSRLSPPRPDKCHCETMFKSPVESSAVRHIYPAIVCSLIV
jgi:hypothetical protein